MEDGEKVSTNGTSKEATVRGQDFKLQNLHSISQTDALDYDGGKIVSWLGHAPSNSAIPTQLRFRQRKDLVM